MNKIWCEHCVKIGTQLTFYAHQTAEMIRGVYNSYIDTDLPEDVKLFLEQYTQEILTQLGEQLT